MAIQRSDRHRFEDWDIFICVGWDALEGAFVGRAELYLEGTFKCRIALGRDFETADAAAAFLARSSHSFIEDWKRREHLTDTDFAEL